MASAFQLSSSWKYLAGMLVSGACVSGIMYARVWWAENGSTDLRGEPRNTQALALTVASAVTTASWSGVVAEFRDGTAVKIAAPERYRLTGIFIIEQADGALNPRAVIADSVRHEERIVGVGDSVDDGSVASIGGDRVSLRTSNGERVLRIEFASSPGQLEEAAGASNLVAAATNRFGCVRTRDDRWQFSRQPLLDYYQELLDEPDRMVAVFDSMKPVRDSNNRITGYMVGIEGEKEFFDAIGLQEGDVVRQVNSVAMTNRRRAEFFIDEFLKNRMSGIVLEIDRGGKRVKHVYQAKE